ncbi:serine hydrolase [Aestuariimicrobium sp. p3-SID1156]|uniref:serine hydrolase domain-containing protein n=1 Tax=Aestuariimicrobium sp. p3-SID1156 TaxID=2916038 RepID=UPI00223AF771|nr:serine hydrolase [Aestuariimicrobium sp. p3-SID1156]MCT1458796.1 serine hydrolase [Aestuariimicrobium sp. p3-SID1156]
MALPRTTPERAGIDPAAITALIHALQDCAELHSVMVLRRGAVVAEGWAKPYRPEHLRLVYSLSKTFASAAVGIAMDEGAFSPEDTLADIFPDQVDDRVGPKARTIRIRDVLSMASGHTTDRIEMVQWRSLLERRHLGEFLRHEPEGEVGVTFCYNQPCTWSATRAVHERLGIDVHSLLQERVFPQLGIDRSFWCRDADGLPWGFSGLHVTTEAIASFFQLLLDEGMRGGERLLPDSWIQEHRRKQVETDPDRPEVDWTQGYGWQVWMSRQGYRGDGAFGQLGVVLPDQDMVVVITARTEDMQAEMDAIQEHLLPGLGRPATPGSQDELDATLAGLALTPVAGEAGSGWSGRDADGRALTLTTTTSGWTCRWEVEDGTTIEFPVGHGEWRESTWSGGGRSTEVAAAAAHGPEGHTVDLVMLNSPHRATLRLPHDSDQATYVWEGPGPLGPQHPWQLAQPF